MELSELVAYAKEKYQIEEQHKWPDFPGFSVLCHPQTGQWMALLMRQWDVETGRSIERCDLKCSLQDLNTVRKSYLSAPVRMHGKNWIGIVFDDETEPETIFFLFDRAIASGTKSVFTIVLDEKSKAGDTAYREILLPFSGAVTKGFPKDYDVKKRQDPVRDVPEKIRRINAMIHLYEYGDGSISNKAKNFYRQGKFMEDYEDDMPWSGEFQRYFTTYHDLNIRQLRGYFTWRTHVRKGDYRPISSSFAYMYLYELLCGIGADSPEDTLRKIKAFEDGFIDSGIGDRRMRENLRRWCREYAVLHRLPLETVLQYTDPAMLERDRALMILKSPQAYSDEEIFSALNIFAGKKLKESPVLKNKDNNGKHLFSAVWRHLSANCRPNDKNMFTACFGRQRTYAWYPLYNAIYFEETPPKEMDFILNACRSYHLRNGVWKERRYERLYFDPDRFGAVIHEADRLFRRYRKTGRYLRQKQADAWVTPYIEAVLEEERRAEIEAARPKVDIDFSGLERIRQDALVTRDSLLTEEEMPMPIAAEEQEEKRSTTAAEKEEVSAYTALEGLDTLHMRILRDLLAGQALDCRMKAERLMPAIVTDTINAALFDKIGDNILECDGDMITLVEDYRQDVIEILGGQSR